MLTSMLYAYTFAMKSVSYGARIANASCSAHDDAGLDAVVAERVAWEDMDMREVIVPCGWMEERSKVETRAEGGRDCGRGGDFWIVTTAAAEGRMSGG